MTSNRARILVYHGVGHAARREDPRRLVLTPARFRSQLRLLLRSGYEFGLAADLANPGSLSARTAILTFDDGWHDAVTTVEPSLREAGARATFFVCPGLLGGRHPHVAGPAGRLLSAGDVRALSHAGMEVGSHAMLHRDLRLLTDKDLMADLMESKTALESITGTECRVFAYPFGLFTEREEAAVERAGYEAAFAWGRSAGRRFSLPRVPAPSRRGGWALALRLGFDGIRRSGASP